MALQPNDGPVLTIASFEGTSQQRFWILSEDRLIALREAANTNATEAVLRTHPARLTAKGETLSVECFEMRTTARHWDFKPKFVGHGAEAVARLEGGATCALCQAGS